MHVRTRKTALAEGLTAGVLFGTAAIFVRLVEHLDSLSIVFWRLVIACVALAVMAVVLQRTSEFGLVGRNVKDLLVLSVFIGLHFVFFTASLKDTTILNATVLVSTVPFFSMLVSILFFKLMPSRFALVGLAISFIGVCVIALGETSLLEPSGPGISQSLKGDLEAVAAALAEVVYLNYGRKIRSQMNILSIMIPIYAITAFVIGIVSIPAGNSAFSVLSFPSSILPLLGLGLLPTAIAHTLYFSSLSNLKSFETATMSLLEPVGATILGIAVFQEIPAPIFIAGACLTLVGIFFTIKNEY